MANRKAKAIVREAFEKLGHTWGVVQEQNWRGCVRDGYFDRHKTVGDYLRYVYFHYGPVQEAIIKEVYDKVELVWDPSVPGYPH